MVPRLQHHCAPPAWLTLIMIQLPRGPHVYMASLLCRWILKADPEAGLEMFTQMNPPLAPATVLPILTAQAPLLCAPYLESAIHAGTATAEVGKQKPAISNLRSVLSDSGLSVCSLMCDHFLGQLFPVKPDEVYNDALLRQPGLPAGLSQRPGSDILAACP